MKVQAWFIHKNRIFKSKTYIMFILEIIYWQLQIYSLREFLAKMIGKCHRYAFCT